MSDKRNILSYNPRLKLLARNLRNNSTLSEIILWYHLKNKQIKGYDFHRQKPIGEYIVDFFCKELMFAIEIDGYTHDSEEKIIKDLKRQKELESYGVHIIRFLDSDIKNNIGGVIQCIEEWIDEFEKRNDL